MSEVELLELKLDSLLFIDAVSARLSNRSGQFEVFLTSWELFLGWLN